MWVSQSLLALTVMPRLLTHKFVWDSFSTGLVLQLLTALFEGCSLITDALKFSVCKAEAKFIFYHFLLLMSLLLSTIKVINLRCRQSLEVLCFQPSSNTDPFLHLCCHLPVWTSIVCVSGTTYASYLVSCCPSLWLLSPFSSKRLHHGTPKIKSFLWVLTSTDVSFHLESDPNLPWLVRIYVVNKCFTLLPQCCLYSHSPVQIHWGPCVSGPP